VLRDAERFFGKTVILAARIAARHRAQGHLSGTQRLHPLEW
jgi:hypothetical protein